MAFVRLAALVVVVGDYKGQQACDAGNDGACDIDDCRAKDKDAA
ncbi:MAG TPA: hypothetical protein VEA59_02905 [Patescibacteria group bacterium]|nr:hypothetical protein [Patescibacteria group bacterium]